MKLLSKQEEDAHYRNVVKGGSIGVLVGLAGGTAGLMLAARRYHTIRNLTLPMKAFLVTSAGSFVGIIAADHASRDFEKQQNAISLWYENREDRLHAEELRNMSFTDRALAFARREKYKIVGATWIASMIGSFVLVGRSPHLSAAFEISDQRRGRGLLDAAKTDKKKQLEAVDEVQPVHAPSKNEGDLWKDMVAAEEERLKSKHQSLHVKHASLHKTADTKADASEDEKDEDKKEE